MNNNSYRFKIGNFKCIAVSDGFHRYPNPIQTLFPTAPEDRRKQVLLEHGIDSENWTEWVSDYTCLAVDTGKQKVLIDTGGGSGLPGVGKLMPDTGLLLQNLKNEGIEPEEIDAVVISHAHPDHIGGMIDIEGKSVFTKASYVMTKEEWDFWNSNPTLEETNMEEMHRKGLVMFASRASLLFVINWN